MSADEGLAVVRRCPTHGYVEVDKFSVDGVEAEFRDGCPVPTYHEEPCGQTLGPRLKIIGLEAL